MSTDGGAPLWAREFGADYECPPLPPGWTDLSWGNDVSPQYRTATGYLVWMEHPDPAGRAFTGDESDGLRFHVCTEPDYEVINWASWEVMGTDDWSQVLALYGRL